MELLIEISAPLEKSKNTKKIMYTYYLSQKSKTSS